MADNCLGCGAPTTEERELCPSCGATARRHTRLLSLILLMLVAAGLYALLASFL